MQDTGCKGGMNPESRIPLLDSKLDLVLAQTVGMSIYRLSHSQKRAMIRLAYSINSPQKIRRIACRMKPKPIVQH